jgi:signal transduction histidine kinase
LYSQGVQSLLLELSRDLQSATSLIDVMDLVVDVVGRATRYQRAWLVLPMPGPVGLEVIGYALPDRQRAQQRMATLDHQADPYLRSFFTATEPMVIHDLREHPTADQRQVEYFGNRTLIAVPMLHLAERVGALCIGTFAAEGVVPPTEEEIAFIAQLGALISVVAGRIRAEEAQRALEEKTRGAQRLEALGLMAGEVAHDFNNMLLSILGNTYLAAELLPDHLARVYLDEIQLAAERAAGLTRQLLSFSRGQPLSRRTFALRTLVDELTPMLRRLVPATVEIELLHEAEGRVHGDAGQLEQVLMNLVVNARDALPRGGTITIATRDVTVDAAYAESHLQAWAGRFARLSVTDDGVGVSAAVAARMFEPFFTTKGPGFGTGLGLAVVDSIVRQHEGWIDLESAEGRGTTFHVFLPVSTARPGAPGLKARDQPVRGGTEHVLVVDDDIQLRVLLERILSGAGYRVSTAENGEVALQMLELEDRKRKQNHAQEEEPKSEAVRLVVSDLVMPKLDGEGLREALAERHPSIRTVFMTGYARDAARSDGGRSDGRSSEGRSSEVGASDTGHDAYPHLLIKPFSPRQLLETVRAVLDA